MEKEDSRRRGLRGVPGRAEWRWSEGDRGSGELPERGGWTRPSTGLGMAWPWPGPKQGEERERRVGALCTSEIDLQKEARTSPNCWQGLLNLAGRDRAGRAGLFFLQHRRGLPRAAEPQTFQSL